MSYVIIDPSEIDALLLLASKDESRYYLNGVFVECYKNSTHSLVATDGRQLGGFRIGELADVSRSFIIDASDAKKALAMAKAEIKTISKSLSNRVKLVVYAGDNLALKIHIQLVDKDNELLKVLAQFESKAIDGTFPDYRRTIPKMPETVERINHCFQGKYLTNFARIAKLLGDNAERVAIRDTGDFCPAFIGLPVREDFTGVLMPMRIN